MTLEACGGQNRLYALPNHQELETSLYLVTGMLKVFVHDVYALLDPRSTLSYVTPYVVEMFGMCLEILMNLFLFLLILVSLS